MSAKKTRQRQPAKQSARRKTQIQKHQKQNNNDTDGLPGLNGPTRLDALPADKSTQRLRQDTIRLMQQKYGNAYVQRKLAQSKPMAQAEATKTSGNEKKPQVQITPDSSTATVQRGFFSSVWKGVKKVGSGIVKGVKGAGSLISKGARSLWGGIKKGAKAAGNVASSIWKGIKKGAKAVGRTASSIWSSIQKGAGTVWSGIKKGAGAVAGAAKFVWDKIKKGAGSVWNALKKGADAVWSGVKWVSGQLWTKVKGIYHRTIGWIRKLPTRLKRLFSHLWEGVKDLKPWSLKWWESLGQASTWKGFLKWLGTAGIYALETAGIGEVYETAADFLKFNTRPLTGGEIAKAKVVFKNAINYDLVRVDHNALLGPSWTKRAYVSFNTINAWGPLTDHTLIHELTHVWQYQHMGAVYMPRAIHAQGTPAGYNYGGIAELRKRQKAGQGISSFNLEQQGEITGDYYVAKSNGGTSAADLATYEHFIKDVRR
ncbi:MAG: hypothetical protein PVH03_07010 [Chloroflexota bacterium]|jgi:hypothetical protein